VQWVWVGINLCTYYAKTEELIELCKVAAEYDVYTTHAEVKGCGKLS
jgi:hypothetical protein